MRVGGEISKYRENNDFCNKTGFMGVFEDAEFISEFRFHVPPSTLFTTPCRENQKSK